MLIRADYSPQWMFTRYSGYLLSVVVVLPDPDTGSGPSLAIVDSRNAHGHASVCYSDPQAGKKGALPV